MEIVWTAYSIESLYALLSFVGARWGEDKAREVRAQIKKDVSLFMIYTKMGACQPEGPVDVRVLVIKKKNKVYYTIKENKVYILVVWDVRQDPENLAVLLNQILER